MNENQKEMIALVAGLLGTTSLPSDSRIDDVLLVAAAIQTKIRLGAGDPVAVRCAELEERLRAQDAAIVVLQVTVDTQARRLAAYQNLATAGVSND